jgi:hypothetical protein
MLWLKRNWPELWHDGRLRASLLVDELHGGVDVGEAEASLHLHPECSVRLGDVGPGQASKYSNNLKRHVILIEGVDLIL